MSEATKALNIMTKLSFVSQRSFYRAQKLDTLTMPFIQPCSAIAAVRTVRNDEADHVA